MQSLPITKGFEWVTETLAFVRRDIVKFFGLSAAYLLVMLVMVIPAELPILAAMKAERPQDAIVPMMLMQLLLVVATPLFVGGWMHAFREFAAGRPVHAGLLFKPFRIAGQPLRLMSLGLIGIAVLILQAGLSQALLGVNYFALMASADQAGVSRLAGFYAITMVVGMLGGAITAFAVPRVALDDVATLPAIRDAIRAALANWRALLGLLLAGLAVALVFFLSLALLAVVLTLLGVLLTKLAGVLGALFVLLLSGVALFGMVLVMPATLFPYYLMWRDVFDDLPPQAEAAPDRIEV